MFDFYGKLIEYFDSGECPVAIFCDLSRAFDCVNHDKLLDTLELFGIRGVALNWVHSYLKDRQQFVSILSLRNEAICEAKSSYIDVNMGIPQGSVLGPVLFNLYINHLQYFVKNCTYTAYADDITFIVSSSERPHLEKECNNILTNITNYFNFHNLHLNINKTQVLQVHNPQKKITDLALKINNTNISNNHESVRFLGIYLNEHLSFKAHCEHLVSRINSLKYLFINLKTILNVKQLFCVYCAKVESILRYGICFWGNSSHCNEVFIAQKRIIRTIVNISPRESCKNYFLKLNILTLPSLFIFEICVYIYKNRSQFPLRKSMHNICTRQANTFHVPFSHFKKTDLSPNIIGLKIFNRLPDSIKSCSSLYSFKKQLKRFLLHKCFYSVSELFM